MYPSGYPGLYIRNTAKGSAGVNTPVSCHAKLAVDLSTSVDTLTPARKAATVGPSGFEVLLVILVLKHLHISQFSGYASFLKEENIILII